MLLFISLGFWDILDILLVAFVFYHVYRWVKGTVAVNIFVGIFMFYVAWLLVKALNMELISSILGQFMGVGVIALLIVFQQEVRRFLLLLGSKYNLQNLFNMNRHRAGVRFFLEDEDGGVDRAVAEFGAVQLRANGGVPQGDGDGGAVGEHFLQELAAA